MILICISMDAVFFYNRIPFIYHDYSFFDQLNDSLKINRKFFDKKILITTEKKIPKNLDIDHIEYMECDSLNEVHFNRIKSWLHFCNSKLFTNNSILLDSDIIFNNDISFLFKNNFAIALNAQKETISPINAGLILVNHTKKNIIKNHFSKIFQLGSKIKHLKDQRFPDIETSGIWGLDEIVLNLYLSNIKKNINLKSFIKNINTEMIYKFSEEIDIIDQQFGISYKYCDKKNTASYFGIHFAGNTKLEMKKYIDKFLKINL